MMDNSILESGRYWVCVWGLNLRQFEDSKTRKGLLIRGFEAEMLCWAETTMSGKSYSGQTPSFSDTR